MLVAGYDSKSLRILAGEESASPTDYFSKAVTELGIAEPNGEDAIQNYIVFLVEQIVVDSSSYRKTVRLLAYFYNRTGHKHLVRWYNLENAMCDIDYGPGGWNPYGLTQENARIIIENEAQDFLKIKSFPTT